MKNYIVYYDQRLEIEVQANDEEQAKEIAEELARVEVSIQGDQVTNDGLSFADIEEEIIDPDNDYDAYDEHDEHDDALAAAMYCIEKGK